jgi:hypothetical protein
VLPWLAPCSSALNCMLDRAAACSSKGKARCAKVERAQGNRTAGRRSPACSPACRLPQAKAPQEASAAEEGAGPQPQQGRGCCRRRGCRRCCWCWCCCPGGPLAPNLVVTLLISVSDLIGAFASGMTLKFFALFFMQVCRVSPAVVSALGVLGPLGISAASYAAQRASSVAGRIQVSLLTRAADVALLVCMAYLPTGSSNARLVSGCSAAVCCLSLCLLCPAAELIMHYWQCWHAGVKMGPQGCARGSCLRGGGSTSA